MKEKFCRNHGLIEFYFQPPLPPHFKPRWKYYESKRGEVICPWLNMGCSWGKNLSFLSLRPGFLPCYSFAPEIFLVYLNVILASLLWAFLFPFILVIITPKIKLTYQYPGSNRNSRIKIKLKQKDF